MAKKMRRTTGRRPAARLGLLGLLALAAGCLLVAGSFSACGGSETKKESSTPDELLKQERAQRAAEQEKAAGGAQQQQAAPGGSSQDAPIPEPTLVAPPTPAPTGPAPAGGAASIPTAEVQNAQLFLRRGQYEQAITQAKAALRRNEKYVPAMVVMALAYYHLKKIEFTESICDIALSIEPATADCYNLKGFIALRDENDAQAKAYFEKATQVRPTFGPGWLNLGAQYLQANNFEAAIPALQKAVELMPNRPEALLNLGSAYRGSGEVLKAAQSYQQALKLKSNYPEAYFNLGILYLDAPSFPGMDRLQQLSAATAHFNKYKQQIAHLAKDDPVETFIQEAQRSYQREQTRLKREAERKAREAAKPAPAPATAPAPPAGQPGQPASAAPAPSAGTP